MVFLYIGIYIYVEVYMPNGGILWLNRKVAGKSRIAVYFYK